MKMLRKVFAVLLLLLSFQISVFSQKNPPRVVLQTFWWDYWNDNYKNGWYNYLTELAPRLKDYGVDAIWIPPSSKGGNGTGDVGYGIFDHYDLGDKYQKGDVKTRLGTKDEYLRMVAVMHANGIDIIQDVVLNHVNGAGPDGANGDNSLGGQDPNTPFGWKNAEGKDIDNKWKNFRYVSWITPATTSEAKDYLNRSGRWFKDWQNFHRSGDPAWGHNDYNYPQHSEMFGPDICYKDDAINLNGKRSVASDYVLSSIYDPDQYKDYMKQEAIKWGVWLKKQTGVDGFRLDAAKHFEWEVTEAFLWNLQHGCGLYGSGSEWANGGDDMFAVSEYIPEGGQPSMENFIDGVQTRTGTFDFNLRDAIYGMVSGGGFFDISSIPGSQIDQNHRNRTVSFVNNHDTFRPRKAVNGNYVGWYDGFHEPSEPDDYPNDPNKDEDNNELRPHIDPFNNRLPAAYAIISAVDGSPQVFFEDLFDVGGTGKRFSHQPTNTSDLPVRDQIKKILQARRVLHFDQGNYKVRSVEANTVFDAGSSKQDLLIIERGSNAIIGVNDNGANSQGAWIDTDFPPNTKLIDYSGNNGAGWFSMVQADKRAYISVPPTNSGGYCILAPTGFDLSNINPQKRTTTQEWEMADDLGDSNPMSLGQGGQLQSGSQVYGTDANRHYVGRIFVEGGTTVVLEGFAEINEKTVNMQIWNDTETDWGTFGGSGQPNDPLNGKFDAQTTGWYKIYVQNTNKYGGAQKVWVKATYIAPQVVNTVKADAPVEQPKYPDWKLDEKKMLNIRTYPTPFNPTATIAVDLKSSGQLRVEIFNMLGQSISILQNGFADKGTKTFTWNASHFSSGVYFYNITFEGKSKTGKMILSK